MSQHQPVTSILLSDTETAHLRRAVSLAVANVAAGGGPFGAVVVRDNRVIAAVANAVLQRSDPTAHAEIEALRAAGAALGTPDLSGAVLYSSCEPCPMCLAGALWSRVDRVIFAATHEEAERGGFDDSAIARQLYGRERPMAMPAGFLHHAAIGEASTPFDAWLALENRVLY